ncbi:MAG: hypothetical protein AAF380_03055 [Bacteroidota bacterium]
MHYKTPRPIGNLIKNTLHALPYQSQWNKAKILQAFKIALPFTQGKIQNCYTKQHVLYIKLNSALLSHELRINKAAVLTKLQGALKDLGEVFLLKNIIFL